jgi:hypothetical protein
MMEIKSLEVIKSRYYSSNLKNPSFRKALGDWGVKHFDELKAVYHPAAKDRTPPNQGGELRVGYANTRSIGALISTYSLT